jgi:hypothetical protein
LEIIEIAFGFFTHFSSYHVSTWGIWGIASFQSYEQEFVIIIFG